MDRFNCEILYLVIKSFYKKNIIKVKNISTNSNSDACYNCKFFFTGCPTPNLIGSCFKRYFIEIKI